MSFEEKLLAAARAETGDESITDVAEFEPKGTAGATAAGAAAGSLAGGAATGDNSWGKAIGAAGGVAAGRAAVGMSKDLPPRICVAVSQDQVYLLAMPNLGVAKLEPLGQIDRHKLGVEVHQRVSVRTIVLEDLDTGNKFALEAKRLNFYHAKAMISMLMLSDEHHEEEAE